MISLREITVTTSRARVLLVAEGPRQSSRSSVFHKFCPRLHHYSEFIASENAIKY